ncbi:lytic transglycosylase domain-containing protein [Agrobacterium tumefaciens]|uniref:lytic transglycosylase domain-containing protein n=1 Tax=Agrobacterium tumefaciens TaxID=358 RepID=UPI002243ABAB|nr:lytic transglycosylase domain-containing protein [Agrobacterium tumefaciens]MCW8060573.1 lytic transglycosylase domain-containing protein [Agrobacterium tumefaciens]MCW8146016.1 lytic transglycosylase domain-containing protein [Agrobacterium tumefaciens]
MAVVFVDVAQQCAPQIVAETLAGVVSVESGFQPFAIRINSDHPLAEQPKSRAEAIEVASTLIADGIDVDLGLAGINSFDLGQLGLSVSDASDICLNLKASASLLDGYYRVAVKAGATDAQAETVMLRSYYGHGDPALGEMVGYDTRVLAESKRLVERLQAIEISQEQASEPLRRDRAAGHAASSDAGTILEHSRSRSEPPAPQWDVFNSGRRSSVLVFSND